MGHRLLRAAALLLCAGLAASCASDRSLLPAGPTPTLFPWSTATSTRLPPTPRPTEAATVVVGPTATPFKHIVRAHETLLGIAALYGVSLDALLAVNPGVDPNFLTIGQELVIPDSEGEPILSLIPSATPIPLALQTPRCYIRPTGGVWCLTALRNESGETLEDIAVRFRRSGPSGDEAQEAEVISPLNFLPPGETMPLAASFDAASAPPSEVSATVLRAIPANEVEGRYRRPSIARAPDGAQAGGLSWRVSGTVTVPSDAPASNQTRLLATAFDASGQAIGFAVWEAEPAVAPGASLPFELRVFSLGPPIARVDLLAETYAVTNAE